MKSVLHKNSNDTRRELKGKVTVVNGLEVSIKPNTLLWMVGRGGGGDANE